MVAVVGGYRRGPERLPQSRDRVEIKLHSRGDDQEVVADPDPGGGYDGAPDGVNFRRAGVDPVHPARNEASLLAGRRFFADDPAADQRPQRLVEVGLGRLDDGNLVRSGPGTNQVRGSGNSRCPAANDKNSLVISGHNNLPGNRSNESAIFLRWPSKSKKPANRSFRLVGF